MKHFPSPETAPTTGRTVGTCQSEWRSRRFKRSPPRRRRDNQEAQHNCDEIFATLNDDLDAVVAPKVSDRRSMARAKVIMSLVQMRV